MDKFQLMIFHYKRQKNSISASFSTPSPFFAYIEVIPSFVSGNIDRFRCFQKPGGYNKPVLQRQYCLEGYQNGSGDKEG
uniref:Uncharacterized protein n=1 Tax=Klebsiella pneumoniae TaxID=573 RepID=A0A8B0ST06_KLEPN|nr:hypothetical protein [Klebsiella pneumoniae]